MEIVAPLVRVERRLLPLVGVGARERAVLDHVVEHLGAPLVGRVLVDERRVARRRLGQAGDERLLPEVELGHVLVEVARAPPPARRRRRCRGRCGSGRATGSRACEYLASRRRAKISSLILRDQVRSDERNALATCCVMVEPPCLTPPARRLAASARTRPRRSKPPCEKKRRSSVDKKASTSGCGTWSSGTISRRSVGQLGRAACRPGPTCVVMPGAVDGVGRQVGHRRQLLAEVEVDAEADEDERRHRRARGEEVELDQPIEQAAVRWIGDRVRAAQLARGTRTWIASLLDGYRYGPASSGRHPRSTRRCHRPHFRVAHLERCSR